MDVWELMVHAAVSGRIQGMQDVVTARSVQSTVAQWTNTSLQEYRRTGVLHVSTL